MDDATYHRQFWKHDGFFGFMNLFKYPHGSMAMLGLFRPHFPVLVDEINVYQVYSSFNLADLGGFLAMNFTLLGIANWMTQSNVDFGTGRKKYSAKGFSVRLHLQSVEQNRLDMRRLYIKNVMTLGVMTGMFVAYANSYMRLGGWTYNGKRWPRRSLTSNKYDFYREHKKNILWKNFIYKH